MQLESYKIKITELLELRRNQMLTVNPEYQRGAVWSEAQQKKLIDSIFRGYPLPLIYLHHKRIAALGLTRDSLEIIDGQQRINAIYAFAEMGLKLFDPVKDDLKARFPEFIKKQPCPWAGCDYSTLNTELREKFNSTELFIVRVNADEDNEARDLFIRLQSGLPLNPQEKRDAWPGGYTEFVLRFGGKQEIDRYPGHEFFRKHILNKSTDRGEIRALCAQIGMLFFENATKGNWLDIGTQAVDDYYYRNLAFDYKSEKVFRFGRVLDTAVQIFLIYNGKKLKVHEAIHIILLIDSLLDDYTREWQYKFIEAFDSFRKNALIDKRRKDGEYWYKYVGLTMTAASQGVTIQRRHSFFTEQMFKVLRPVRKDGLRIFGQVERELIFYRDKKQCAVCGYEVNWQDLEIHHIEEHQHGGETSIENGVAVHKQCHPKGQAAKEFYEQWQERKTKQAELKTSEGNLSNPYGTSLLKFKIENPKRNILAFAIITDSGKLCILQGSTISSEVSDSFNDTCKAAAKRRNNLIADGSIDSNFIFTKDIVFNSKSNAASLVLGFSANGNTSWLPINNDNIKSQS